MKIEIEIPKEFESDYNGDKFKDFFSRVLCDIENGNGVLCGNYEKEIAEMFINAFCESKFAYNVDAVVAKLKSLSNAEADYYYANSNDVIDRETAIDIVEAGGAE